MEPYAGFEPQVGEIRAVRTFRVGPGGRLHPLFSSAPWLDGINDARCRANPIAEHESHRPPEPECTCGFYAYGNEEFASEYLHSRHVLAVISCWGRVIAGTRGLRSQNCRIEALWLSDSVPTDLVAEVVERYPSVKLYGDKHEMLRDFPPTSLDCYEAPTGAPPPRMNRWQRLGLAAALICSALPASWLGGNLDARLIWGATLVYFIVAAVILSRRHLNDLGSRRRLLVYQASALWMAAPLAGPAGLLLLRLPLVQLGALVLVQWYRMARGAARFPARIA
jgi:hypothetical protein